MALVRVSIRLTRSEMGLLMLMAAAVAGGCGGGSSPQGGRDGGADAGLLDGSGGGAAGGGSGGAGGRASGGAAGGGHGGSAGAVAGGGGDAGAGAGGQGNTAGDGGGDVAGAGGDLGGAGGGNNGGAGDGGGVGGGGGGGGDGGAGAGGGGGGGGGSGAACPVISARSAFVGPPFLEFVSGVSVTTLAGGAESGSTDGQGAAARFDNPVSVTLGSTGDVFVLDYDSGLVRRVTGAGAVTTVATLFDLQPFGLVAAGPQRLFVDTDKSPSGAKSNTTGTIWAVDPSTGAKEIVKANIGRPRGVARLPDGRLVLGDPQNDVVRLLDPGTMVVSVLAGSGCPGFADGQGRAAAFDGPYGVAVRSDGKIVVADSGNGRLRIVDLAGNVTTWVGGDAAGTNDGTAAEALFDRPVALAIDAADNVYVSDVAGHRLRRVRPDGRVSTVAGDGAAGFRDDVGASARFFGQEGLTVTADGATIYVADGSLGDPGPYHRLRKVTITP